MELDRYRSLKRIQEEFYQMQSNPSDDFKCCLLERNPYEWQFAIRGPSGTELEGGIYHGWIQFPEEYPSKPPSFTLLTENGCFKTQNKTGIRRLNYWQPSWRVRDGLLALIDEMHTYPDGELDSVEYNREERRDLAIKSRAAAPKYGTAERQKEEVVVDRVGSTQMELDRSVIVEDKSNIQNSGEKRILEEYNEIESNPSNDFKCLKLDWNPYEWQFAIRGPSGTEFEGGIYHGVVQFSEGYPSKPPSIMFLTKNGRFKTQTDISARLLLNWQSPRIVRNALLALIEEMPTYPDGDGELDSVKYNKNIMRVLAINSRIAAPKYGTSERQKVIDAIHEYMLSKAPPVPQLQLSSLSQNGAERKHGRGTGSVFNNIIGNKVHATNGRVRFLRSMNGPPEPMIAKIFGLVLLFSSILYGILSGRRR
ncbi:ubiquitin-conjugating enzyme E2 J1 isoform X2 [Prunus persica]|uniref:ubiquitin-conjugating enzyme E2 J1 isoform X2 n=1 Tax=Prunus persica TaxID=3760 RepID=UPI0009AB2EC2|nr:ubiquitin-conjugating enzyme E2 J1 isoform X2 [Prunus persica]